MSETSATSDASWSVVLSQASHEIRTPLSVALGYLRMVLGERAGPLTDKQRQFIAEVEKAIGKMTALTEELSDLAHFDSAEPKERTRFNPTPLALGPLVSEAVAALPALTDGRQTAVEFEDHAPDAHVHGDRRHLLKALTSVLYVSRRELVGSERLLVRLRRAASDAGPVLRVNIAGDHRIDTLEAMPDEDLVPFDEKRGGCGLGPSIARRIVSEHAGRIRSTPEPPVSEDGSQRELLKQLRRSEIVLILPETE
jgi:signal transduction histidine kinase